MFPNVVTYWKDNMAKFITAKSRDGADDKARERGFSWALQSSVLYIYTPTKKIAKSMATDPLPSGNWLKSLLKTNAHTSGKTTINLCFGSGSGSCGSVPAPNFTGNILLCYSSPDEVDWLLKRAPHANFCLLPWLVSEADTWRDVYNPEIV